MESTQVEIDPTSIHEGDTVVIIGTVVKAHNNGVWITGKSHWDPLLRRFTFPPVWFNTSEIVDFIPAEKPTSPVESSYPTTPSNNSSP